MLNIVSEMSWGYVRMFLCSSFWQSIVILSLSLTISRWIMFCRIFRIDSYVFMISFTIYGGLSGCYAVDLYFG